MPSEPERASRGGEERIKGSMEGGGGSGEEGGAGEEEGRRKGKRIKG